MSLNKIFGIYIVLGICYPCSAQSLERSTLDVAGGVAKTDQFEVHYSFGQSFVKSIDLGAISVHEGFIQGSISEISTSVELYPGLTIELSPNPSFEAVRIHTSEVLPGSQIHLYNVEGQLISKSALEQNMVMEIGHFPSGSYFLQWLDQESQLVRQFKLIKI